MGLTEIAEDYLQDRRTGRNILHHLVPLLRQSIFSRLAGYDDTNDADRLAYDPAMRVVVGWQGSERKAASTSEMGRFERETLTEEKNLKGLARMNSQWVEGAMVHTPHRRVILDMDSSESPVHGQQEGAAYNGHFECVCYHPLFLFNQFGDCEAAKLRSGNVHSADDWQEVLDPVVERYLIAAVRLLFRADAAFAKPEIYEYLEARSIGYAIRLRSNQVLQREIAHLLVRPAEWPSPKPIISYHDFVYQAQSWNVSRRVVAKVEWHQGELFPRVGFIVTNLTYPTIGDRTGVKLSPGDGPPTPGSLGYLSGAPGKPPSKPEPSNRGRNRQGTSKPPQRYFAASMPVPADPTHPARRWLAARNLWQPGFPLPSSLRWLPAAAHRPGPHQGAGSIVALAATPLEWAIQWPNPPPARKVQIIALDEHGKPVLDRPANIEGLLKRTLGEAEGAVLLIGCLVPPLIPSPVRVSEGVADALALASRFLGPAMATLGTGDFHSDALANWLAPGRKAAGALRRAVQGRRRRRPGLSTGC